MNVTKFEIEHYAGLLRRGQPFALSRWGDGEFAAVFGLKGKNCDGHEYFPELGADLRRALMTPGAKYYQGLLRVAGAAGPERVAGWLAKYAPAVNFVDGDVFVDSMLAGRLRPFIGEMRKKRVLYIGPSHLMKLKGFGIAARFDYMKIPAVNAYLKKKAIVADVLRAVDRFGYDLIGLSAGMTANVLIDEIYPRTGVTMIDFGSLFDGWVGVKSRKYIRRVTDFTPIVLENLRESDDTNICFNKRQ